MRCARPARRWRPWSPRRASRTSTGRSSGWRRPTSRSRSRPRWSRRCCRRSTRSGRPCVSSSRTEVAEIRMPQMGVSVAEGTVVEWRKQPGDWVEADEAIAAISTDKIDTDVEAPAAGRLTEIVVAEGDTVEVGTVLALIATDAKPGEAHSSEGTSEAAVALEAPGDAGDLPGDTDARHAPAREAPAPRGNGGGRPH